MLAPVLIQGALQSELDYLLNTLEIQSTAQEAGYVFYECLYKGCPVIVSKTKMGEVSAAIATVIAIKKYAPAIIINQGTAGAFAMHLNVGDIVVGERICYISQFATESDKENEPLNPWKRGEYRTIDNEIMSYKCEEKLLAWLKSLEVLKNNTVYFDTVGSGDVWTKSPELIKEYNSKYGITCEAMECTGVYFAANSFNTPAVTLRVISNNEVTQQPFDETTSLFSQKLALTVTDEYFKEVCK